MALKSLHAFDHVRFLAISARKIWVQFRYGVVLGRDVSISMSSRLSTRSRQKIFVGDETLIAFKTLIFTYDHGSRIERPVNIGRRCFIGGGSMITPGVTIGDNCIVGAGSVVLEDVPDRTIVAGNPARIIRRDIDVGRYGRLAEADEKA